MTYLPRSFRLLAIFAAAIAIGDVGSALAQAPLPPVDEPALATDDPGLRVAAAKGAANQPEPATAPAASALAYGNGHNHGRSSLRLASVPHMYGDFGSTGGQVFVSENSISFGTGVPTEISSGIDLPAAGGSRRVKISENNAALPIDRVYFFYNHFHNALDAPDPLDPGETISSPIDRYTMGYEKTFFDGWASLELRLPLTGTYDYANADITVEGGAFGNLALAYKQLISQGDTYATAVGLGIDLPTGSDVGGELFGTPYRVRNESLHLLPFFGGMWAPGDSWFFHAFVQLDIAANGNNVEGGSPATVQTLGTLTEQNLLYVDFSSGYWLFRDEGASLVTGLAASLELHYNTSVQDVDFVTGVADNTRITIGSLDNRFDIINLTAGLNAELWGTAALRTAVVTPLTQEPNRFFDAEIQVSFIWRL